MIEWVAICWCWWGIPKEQLRYELNIFKVPTGSRFCRIFLHQLVIAPNVNVVKMLENVFCTSRDGVPLGPEKDNCRQDSLSKPIDWYHSLPPSVFIRQYLYRDMAMTMRRIFWGFCINRFGIGPLHYVWSCSDFSLEFAEIFVIKKRLPDSPSRGVDKNAYR